MRSVTCLLFTIVIIMFAMPEMTHSNERRFGYVYESSVLPVGAHEIELWNTYRQGRDYFYRRLDQRIEYEFGVANNLMSAFYFNATSRSKDSNEDAIGGGKSNSYSVTISSEWKYKLMDRVADPFGFALYGEGTLGTDKYELEAKLIFDKQVQSTLLALDLVSEYESSSDVISGSQVVDTEIKLKANAGATYIFSNGLGAAVEVRNENIYISGSLRHSALFAGPTISFASNDFWFTLSILPQVFSFKGGTTQSKNLDFDEFEKVQTRLLLAFHI